MSIYNAERDFPGWDDLTPEQKGHVADIEQAAFWRGYNYEEPPIADHPFTASHSPHLCDQLVTASDGSGEVCGLPAAMHPALPETGQGDGVCSTCGRNADQPHEDDCRVWLDERAKVQVMVQDIYDEHDGDYDAMLVSLLHERLRLERIVQHHLAAFERLRDLVAEFRKRDEAASGVIARLRTERDATRAAAPAPLAEPEKPPLIAEMERAAGRAAQMRQRHAAAPVPAVPAEPAGRAALGDAHSEGYWRGYDQGWDDHASHAGRHQPVIAESTTTGVWNVYCDACSQAERDYVYPCRKGWVAAPPGRLAAPAPLAETREAAAALREAADECDERKRLTREAECAEAADTWFVAAAMLRARAHALSAPPAPTAPALAVSPPAPDTDNEERRAAQRVAWLGQHADRDDYDLNTAQDALDDAWAILAALPVSPVQPGAPDKPRQAVDFAETAHLIARSLGVLRGEIERLCNEADAETTEHNDVAWVRADDLRAALSARPGEARDEEGR